jgi:hypothetical protein
MDGEEGWLSILGLTIFVDSPLVGCPWILGLTKLFIVISFLLPLYIFIAQAAGASKYVSAVKKEKSWSQNPGRKILVQVLLWFRCLGFPITASSRHGLQVNSMVARGRDVSSTTCKPHPLPPWPPNSRYMRLPFNGKSQRKRRLQSLAGILAALHFLVADFYVPSITSTKAWSQN